MYQGRKLNEDIWKIFRATGFETKAFFLNPRVARTLPHSLKGYQSFAYHMFFAELYFWTIAVLRCGSGLNRLDLHGLYLITLPNARHLLLQTHSWFCQQATRALYAPVLHGLWGVPPSSLGPLDSPALGSETSLKSQCACIGSSGTLDVWKRWEQGSVEIADSELWDHRARPDEVRSTCAQIACRWRQTSLKHAFSRWDVSPNTPP